MEKKFLYSKILVVDDEVEVCGALRQFLEEEQFKVEVANDGEQALAKVDEFKPHCVLLDIRMPNLNGIDALKMIKFRQPEIEIIMVTAVSNIKIAEQCMRDGAFGYIPKPVDVDYLLKEVRTALTHREEALEKHRQQLGDNLTHEAMIQQLDEDLATALRFPLDLIELIYPELGCHSKNVAWLCKMIAEHLGLSQIRLFELGGLYHDIGQVCLPKSLQQKPLEKMSFKERAIFEKFPLYGENLVQSHLHLKALGTIIKHQCENIDGTGFPGMLEGGRIPIGSKIIAVANAFDEALQNRGLRNIEQDLFEGRDALDLISCQVGKKFDSVVVSVLANMTKKHKYKQIMEVKIGVNSIKPGMLLSRDVIAESGDLLINRQTTVTPLLLGKILDWVSMGISLTPIYVYTKSDVNSKGSPS